ncbi:hypothetical protein JL722_4013 [Aureococcus anophagefferens]|nr:hypothetical protein JL722_4013 [Aureococcus anophagefferens]
MRLFHHGRATRDAHEALGACVWGKCKPCDGVTAEWPQLLPHKVVADARGAAVEARCAAGLREVSGRKPTARAVEACLDVLDVLVRDQDFVPMKQVHGADGAVLDVFDDEFPPGKLETKDYEDCWNEFYEGSPSWGFIKSLGKTDQALVRGMVADKFGETVAPSSSTRQRRLRTMPSTRRRSRGTTTRIRRSRPRRHPPPADTVLAQRERIAALEAESEDGD